MVTPDSLKFISAEVIERLKNGSFVANRTARRHAPRAEGSEGKPVSDRRKTSPLSIIKRCIRYEPLVFKHRPAQIMKLISALNDPVHKIILVGGEQGLGKTSLARALLEPMGGGLEQVLWFDVNRHTDFDEVSHFLLRTIQQLFSPEVLGASNSIEQTLKERRADRDRQATDAPRSSAGTDPLLLQLEKQLKAVSHVPLLLVLDNVEFLVDASLRLNSAPFKDVLNFLLDFPNIKMLLLGERLPYADMIPNEESILDIRLTGLKRQDAVDWLTEAKAPKAADNALLEEAALADALAENPEAEAIASLVQKSHGSPWILKTILRLQHATRLPFPTLNAILNFAPDSGTGQSATTAITRALTQLIEERLPDQQRALLYLFSFIRHPVNLPSLQAMVGSCYPALTPERLNSMALEAMLDNSLLRCLLRVSYPPQEVLAHVRQGSQSGKFQPGYELQLTLKQLISQRIPAVEKERLHNCLRELYIRERGLESKGRILRIKNRALLSEARYHSAALREPNLEQAAANNSGSQTVLSGKAPLVRSAPPYTAPFRSAPYSGDLDKESSSKSFREELSELPPLRSRKERKTEIPLDIEPDWPVGGDDPSDNVAYASKSKTSDVPVPKSIKVNAANASLPTRTQWGDLQSVLGKEKAHSQTDQQEKELHGQLETALAAKDPKILARTLLELSRFRFGRGQAQSALPLLESALSLKADLPKDLQAELYQLQGSVLKSLYHHNAALKSLKLAADLVRKLIYGDDTVSGIWFARLGRIYQDFGDIYAYREQNDSSQTSYNEALRWYGSANEEALAAEVHFQLACLAQEREELTTAILHYEKAIAWDEAHHNPLSAAASLSNLGNLHLEAKHFSEAARRFQQALTQDRLAGNLEGQLNTLSCLFDLYFQQENYFYAERSAKEGLALAIREFKHFWQASFHLKFCELAESQEEWQPALRQAQLALSSGDAELSTESKNRLELKIQDLSLKTLGHDTPSNRS